MQRIGEGFLGESRYYEEGYAEYYERAGASRYDAPRYAIMADWMKDALGEFDPDRILDVGCGAGWSLVATRERYPNAQLEGVEPSEENAARAEASGFPVHRLRMGEDRVLDGKFDLVYANNVFMHVVEPAAFLGALTAALSPKGRIVLICPDASEPSSELLWADHNYSFVPDHIVWLAAKVGLRVDRWLPAPGPASLSDKQLIVLAANDVPAAEPYTHAPKPPSPERLLEGRRAYMTRWRALDAHLCRETERSKRVFNFGSSMWTWLLAAYCPQYWERVEAATIDGFAGRCQGKAVLPFEGLQLVESDALVLGVNPESQLRMRARFDPSRACIVSWDTFMSSHPPSHDAAAQTLA